MNQPDLAELERLLPDAQSMTLDEFSDATPEERIAATGRVKRARDKLFAALPALIECAKALEPFAAIAPAVEQTDKRDGDVVHRQCSDGEYFELTKDHFRAAALALTTLGHPHG